MENNVVQPDQQDAFNNYTKSLPAFQTLSEKFKIEENVIVRHIEKIEKTKSKVIEKINKFMKGNRSQAAKKSRTTKRKALEKLAKAKKKIVALKSKFQNS